ncbi:MAG: DUF4186 domain-containing protein [Candidatus Brocadiia bacterium]|nr:MAG: DUF4186 domain-containing protein [Candidatus Brocadiia bacterium]
MRDIDELFDALSRSKFRSRFRLSKKDADYLETKGLEAVLEHARQFVETRLAPADLPNDGRQTPMKNHPAFVAQHAVAACCRKCLEKWHGINQGKPLTADHVDHIIKVMKRWLEQQIPQNTSPI